MHCLDCKMSATIEPFYDCTNYLLTVYWPTDKLYPATILEPPAVLSDALKKRLDQLDAKRALEIFIPSHFLPIYILPLVSIYNQINIMSIVCIH